MGFTSGFKGFIYRTTKSGGAGGTFAVSCRARSVLLHTACRHNARHKAFKKNIFFIIMKITNTMYFFFCSAATQRGSWPPHS